MLIISDHIASTSPCSLPKSLPAHGLGQNAANVSEGCRREPRGRPTGQPEGAGLVGTIPVAPTYPSTLSRLRVFVHSVLLPETLPRLTPAIQTLLGPSFFSF